MNKRFLLSLTLLGLMAHGPVMAALSQPKPRSKAAQAWAKHRTWALPVATALAFVAAAGGAYAVHRRQRIGRTGPLLAPAVSAHACVLPIVASSGHRSGPAGPPMSSGQGGPMVPAGLSVAARTPSPSAPVGSDLVSAVSSAPEAQAYLAQLITFLDDEIKRLGRAQDDWFDFHGDEALKKPSATEDKKFQCYDNLGTALSIESCVPRVRDFLRQNGTLLETEEVEACNRLIDDCDYYRKGPQEQFDHYKSQIENDRGLSERYERYCRGEAASRNADPFELPHSR